MMLFPFLSAGIGASLGLSLGANDGGNLFGTAVATRVISFRFAALLAGIAIIAGAYFQGADAIETIHEMTKVAGNGPLIIVASSCITIIIMTWLKLPVSTSQSLVGAIMGVTISMGVSPNETKVIFDNLYKMIFCWILTPIGSGMIAMTCYYCVGALLNNLPISLLTRDKIIRAGLIVVGTYSAYAFGVNNTANVVGVFVESFPTIAPRALAVFGAVSIALGIFLFGRGLMETIGAGLIRLDGFTALVVVMGEAVTLHFFGVMGVPVSASQAVVGGVLGIALIRGPEAIDRKLLKNIFTGWLTTPLISFILATAGYSLLIGISTPL